MQRIAIIGAGITGTMLAHRLQERAEVTLFEKARGVGGRMSARYAPPYFFDHGAQYFTARSEAFRRFLTALVAKGVVAEWSPALVRLAPGRAPEPTVREDAYYVACPHMNGLCKFLAEGSQLRTATEIAPLHARRDTGWELFDTQGQSLGLYDRVISTAPYQQTLRLFGDLIPADAPLPSRPLTPCFALMIGSEAPWPHPWQAAQAEESPIGWIALNSSKPGRDAQATSLVVHASHAWSEAHLEADPARVEADLLSALDALGALPERIAYRSLHRWRYALSPRGEDAAPYLHISGLAAAGDWTSAAGRIEHAWEQAVALADRL